VAVALLALIAIVALLAALALWKQDGLRSRWSRYRVPRIVFVSIDTLNLLYTDVHQPGVDLTPELLRLAEGGTVFSRSYTPVSITLPAHSTALTGLEPVSLGVMVNGDVLDEEFETLPEVLHRSGYRTGAVVSLGVLKENFGLGQGFEWFDDAIEEANGRWYRYADEVVDRAIDWVDQQAEHPFFLWVHLSDPHEPYRPRDAGPDSQLTLDGSLIGEYSLGSKERYEVSLRVPPGKHQITWTSLRTPRPEDKPGTALVLELLERDSWPEALTAAVPPETPSERFLFEPVTIDIDNPTDTELSFDLTFRGRINDPSTTEVLEAYRTEVRYTDSELGRLRQAFAERGLDEDTLWVIVSDHGEGLGHHGILGHATYAQEDHMRSLFVLNGPGIPSGKRVEDAIVAMSDVAPTLIDHLGLRGLELRDGSSQTECWTSTGCPGREEYWVYGASVSSNQVTAVAGYRDQYKILWQKNRRFAVYDLEADPNEETNLSQAFQDDSSSRPQAVGELGSSFDPQRELFQKRLEARGSTLTPEQEEMLKSLGYLNP